jgi:hypothetical protein
MASAFPDQDSDIDKKIRLWEMKKLLKKLESYKGLEIYTI